MKPLPSGRHTHPGRGGARRSVPGALLLAVLATLVGQTVPAAAVAQPPAATAAPLPGAQPGPEPSAGPSAPDAPAPAAGPAAPPAEDPKAAAEAAAEDLRRAGVSGACPPALTAAVIAACTLEPGVPVSFSFTLPQAQDVLFVRILTTVGAVSRKLLGPDGTEPDCDRSGESQYGGLLRCTTTQAGTYTLRITEETSIPADLAVSYRTLLAPGACRTVGAADLSLAAPTAFRGSLPPGSAGECYLAPDLVTGDRLRIHLPGLGLDRTVFDAAGRPACTRNETWEYDLLDCTLSGPAPFRVGVQAGYGAVPAYDLTLARLAATQGCAVVVPQAFGTAPDTAPTARCRTLRITEQGPYSYAAVKPDGEPLTGVLFAADGSRPPHGTCGPGAGCLFAPGDYTWVVDPRTPAGQAFGATLRSDRETRGCTATGDSGFASGPVTGGFGAPGRAPCLTLPTAAGNGVYLLNRPPDGMTGASFAVLDATGLKQCENLYAYSSTICRLTGTAPFRAVLSGTPDQTYRLVIHRTGETAGCAAWPRSAFDGGWGAEVTPTRDAPQACLALPAGAHSTAEAVDYANAANTGGASVKVVDPTGTVLCEGGAFTCAFAAGTGYTTLLDGRSGETYRLSRRDISPDAACLTPNATAVGGRSLPLDLTSALDARCVRVTAAATDRLWLSARSTAGRYDPTVQLQVADGSGRTVCVQFGYACKVTGATTYTLVVLAAGHKGGGPIHTDVDTWRVGTAAGWAPECTAHPVSAEGFALRGGLLTESSTAYCAVVDMKPSQSFDVFGTTSAPSVEKPVLDLMGPAVWDESSATYTCSSSYGLLGGRCTAHSNAVAGQAVLLVSPGRAATPVEYTVQGVCDRTTSTCGGRPNAFALNSIAPATGAAGTQTQVTIRGAGLTLGTKLRLTGTGGSSQYTLQPLSVNPGGTELHALVDTYGYRPGTYDVVLDGYGSGGPALAGAFTVTPEPAPAKGRFVPVSPSRILNTVHGVGAPAGRVGQGGVVSLRVAGAGGVPATGATAVVMNVTAVNPTRAGAVSVYPGGQKVPDLPTVSFAAGQNVTNLATVPLADGRVDLRNAWGEVDLGVDVVGYYTDGTDRGSLLSPVSPSRILNTVHGVGAPAGRVGPGGVVPLKVTGVAGVPASGVTAVVMSVTAVDPTATGYVTAYPHGEAAPDASAVNFAAGQNVSNLVTVPVGADGRVDLRNARGAIDLGVDVLGYYGASGATYTPSSLVRLLDTRTGEGARIGTLGGDGDMVSLKVAGVEGVPAAGVTSVLMNVTAVWPTDRSFLTVYPHGQGRPDASNLNYRPGEVVSTLVMVPVVDGRVSFANQWGSTDVVADLIGYFSI
ncbi:hypothetical protein ACFCX4_19275 [Kitasatospora sp. NPDC056327]|uniref:hypothetical protein n=1 Tax=Kitasatospora sp. NPDC056327 TaxID=3345785 RepID=UPI0035DE583A